MSDLDALEALLERSREAGRVAAIKLSKVSRRNWEDAETRLAIALMDAAPTLIAEARKARAAEVLAGVVERLIDHTDDMEAQHQDYHTPDGPLRSQVLCEAIAALQAYQESVLPEKKVVDWGDSSQ